MSSYFVWLYHLTIVDYCGSFIMQVYSTCIGTNLNHDDVIKWKHFPRYWPFVRGIHRPPVNSPHKGQWRGALMFSLICARINGWVNNREARDLRRHTVHCDVIVMASSFFSSIISVSGNLKMILIRICHRKSFKTEYIYGFTFSIFVCADTSTVKSVKITSMFLCSHIIWDIF